MPLCDYGCGQEAKYKFKGGKWCCSESWKNCSNMRNKIRESQKNRKPPKIIKNLEHKLCRCGQEAKYEFANGNLCCSKNRASCPNMKNKNRESQKNRKQKQPKRIENLEHKLCNFGCGQEAKYEFANGNLCCEVNTSSCLEIRRRTGISHKGLNNHNPKRIENLEHKLCNFGCGQEAKYEFANGNLCCSKSHNSCSALCIKRSKSRTGITGAKSKKIENLERKLCDYGCGQIAKYEFANGNLCCSTHVQGCSSVREKNSKSSKYSIEDWIEKYPFLGKVEEMRYHPKTKEIQVHCKNHSCEHSKENEGWFTPSSVQICDRGIALEREIGFGESNFYCSIKCKQQCPLFDLHYDPLSTPKDVYYTDEEYQTFRQEVFRKDNYICQMCEKKPSVHVHHTRPKKLEPFFALDPDYGFSVCEDCHKFIHRAADKGGSCSYGELANKICNQEE